MNERAGQELSAEARQLIVNARGADDPTAEDEARVKARWLAGIAAGAGVSSLSEAVRAAASAGWSWGMKAAVLAGAAAVAAVGVYLGWPEAESPRAEAPAVPGATTARRVESAVTEPEQTAVAPLPGPAAPQAAEHARAAAPMVAEPLAEAPAGAEAPSDAVAAPLVEAPIVAAPEPQATPAAGPRPARSHAARPKPSSRASTRKPGAPEATGETLSEVPASPATTGQLGEEIARLSEIRGQLQAGTPARALELLGDYRARFAEPNLAMEADALQVDALCKAGRRDAAREAAVAFASRWPSSPLEQRVSRACQ